MSTGIETFRTAITSGPESTSWNEGIVVMEDVDIVLMRHRTKIRKMT